MSDTYEIDKDVQLSNKSRPYIYPYRDMDVGDSFFVPEGKMPTVNAANYRAFKSLGWKFSARKQDGGIRVWRTS
jgi:hypothetical protein